MSVVGYLVILVIGAFVLAALIDTFIHHVYPPVVDKESAKDQER
jgi:hypothetical protein